MYNTLSGADVSHNQQDFITVRTFSPLTPGRLTPNSRTNVQLPKSALNLVSRHMHAVYPEVSKPGCNQCTNIGEGMQFEK